MLEIISNNQTGYPTTDSQISRKKTYTPFNFLSIKGRMGRFAYFFYSLVSPFLLFWVMAAIAGVIGKMGEIGSTVAHILVLLTVLSVLYIVMQLTIKRCHDFNASGWISPLIFIPFACLFFWLIPGNDGMNQYAEAPEPPSYILKMGCLILISLLVATMTYQALTKLL